MWCIKPGRAGRTATEENENEKLRIEINWGDFKQNGNGAESLSNPPADPPITLPSLTTFGGKLPHSKSLSGESFKKKK